MNIKKLLTTLSDLDKPVIRESVKQPIKTESRKATSLSDKLLESFGLFEAEVADIQNPYNPDSPEGKLFPTLSQADKQWLTKSVQNDDNTGVRPGAPLFATDPSIKARMPNKGAAQLQIDSSSTQTKTGAEVEAEYLTKHAPPGAGTTSAGQAPTASQSAVTQPTPVAGGSTQVIAMQRELKAAGANLGTFGVNKDGIDGKMGKYTAKALLAHPNIAAKYPDLAAQAGKIVGAATTTPQPAQQLSPKEIAAAVAAAKSKLGQADTPQPAVSNPAPVKARYSQPAQYDAEIKRFSTGSDLSIKQNQDYVAKLKAERDALIKQLTASATSLMNKIPQ